MQSISGDFTPFGRKDILATAIGKEEHPGRVRGTRTGVGIKEFFGSKRMAAGPSREEIQEMIRTAVAEAVVKERSEAYTEAYSEAKMEFQKFLKEVWGGQRVPSAASHFNQYDIPVEPTPPPESEKASSPDIEDVFANIPEVPDYYLL